MLILPFSGLLENFGLLLEIIANKLYGNIQAVLQQERETTENGRAPQRKRAISSGFPTVADKPMRWNSPAYTWSRSSATAESGTAFAPRKFVYLIDDNESDLREMLPKPFSHEKCLNRFRGSNQEIGWRQCLFTPFSHASIPMTHTYGQPPTRRTTIACAKGYRD